MNGKTVITYAAVAVLIIGLYGGRIAGFPFQDPDEGRYAEIAREMIVRGDWITPTLNFVKYFDKPPLLYWLTALSFAAFGVTEAAGRLIAATAGLATIAMTFLLGQALFGVRAAAWAAILLATTPLVFVFSQALTTDMLLTAATTATLAALLGVRRAERKGGWALAVAVFAAVGVLAKGLVALVIPGLIGGAYLTSRGDSASLRALLRLSPIVAFFLVAAPWFVIASTANPEFARYFFVHEHLQRFATDEVGHPRGPLFYVPVLLGGAFPWTLLFALLLLEPEGRAAFSRIDRDMRSYLVWWSGTVVLFFTLARSKLPAYVLPAFPALALLGAAWLDEVLERGALASRVARRFSAALLIFGGTVAATAGAAWLVDLRVASMIDRDPADVRTVATAALLAGVSLVLGGLGARMWRRGGSGARSAGLPAAALGVGAALFALVGARAAVKTSREIGLAIRDLYRPGDLIVSYHRLMHGLPFYSGTRAVQVIAAGELKLGLSLTDSRDRAEYFWENPNRLAEEWRSGRRVFVATTRNFEADLAALLEPPPRVLVRDDRRVLLANFAASPGPYRPVADRAGDRLARGPATAPRAVSNVIIDVHALDSTVNRARRHTERGPEPGDAPRSATTHVLVASGSERVIGGARRLLLANELEHTELRGNLAPSTISHRPPAPR